MRYAFPILTLTLLISGCASTPETGSYLREQSGGLPLFAAFVYEEEVHAVGGGFSAAPVYWKEAYPVAAESVMKANRFASYDEALTSGADILVIAKNRVYGSRDIYKTSLVVYVRDRGRNLLAETGFQGKQTTKADEKATFRALGQLIRDHIHNSRKVKALARNLEP